MYQTNFVWISLICIFCQATLQARLGNAGWSHYNLNLGLWRWSDPLQWAWVPQRSPARQKMSNGQMLNRYSFPFLRKKCRIRKMLHRHFFLFVIKEKVSSQKKNEKLWPKNVNCNLKTNLKFFLCFKQFWTWMWQLAIVWWISIAWEWNRARKGT